MNIAIPLAARPGMRLLKALLFYSLVLTPAFGAERLAKKPVQLSEGTMLDNDQMRKIKKIEDELAAIKEELIPLAKGMEGLRRAYEGGTDPRPLTETRKALHAQFQARLDRFDILLTDFQQIGHEMEQRNTFYVMSQLARKQLDTYEHMKLWATYYDMDNVRRLNHNYLWSMRNLKWLEDREYRAAIESLKKRRILPLYLAGGIGILIVLFIIGRRLLGKTMAISKGLGAGSATQAIVASRYLLEREMRRDNLGSKHAAVDLQTGRSVLFWLADKNAGASIKPAASLAQAAILLHHPNLAAMLEVMNENELFFLVSEYVEGKSLLELLRERKSVSLASTVEVIRQSAFALDYLHQLNLAHGSICPSNLHLGEDGRLRVLGFRIPQAALADYTAPEQNMGPPTPACDVFALGACAYEMLTGTQAFPGPEHGEQKRRGLYAVPSKSGLPPEIDEALRPALLPDPGGRYRNCAQFAQALEAVLNRRRPTAPV